MKLWPDRHSLGWSQSRHNSFLYLWWKPTPYQDYFSQSCACDFPGDPCTSLSQPGLEIKTIDRTTAARRRQNAVTEEFTTFQLHLYSTNGRSLGWCTGYKQTEQLSKKIDWNQKIRTSDGWRLSSPLFLGGLVTVKASDFLWHIKIKSHDSESFICSKALPIQDGHGYLIWKAWTHQEKKEWLKTQQVEKPQKPQLCIYGVFVNWTSGMSLFSHSLVEVPPSPL